MSVDDGRGAFRRLVPHVMVREAIFLWARQKHVAAFVTRLHHRDVSSDQFSTRFITRCVPVQFNKRRIFTGTQSDPGLNAKMQPSPSPTLRAKRPITWRNPECRKPPRTVPRCRKQKLQRMMCTEKAILCSLCNNSFQTVSCSEALVFVGYPVTKCDSFAMDKDTWRDCETEQKKITCLHSNSFTEQLQSHQQE